MPSPHGSPEMGPLAPHIPEVQAPHTTEQQRTGERPALQEQAPHDPVGGAPPPMPVIPLPPATSPVAQPTAQAQAIIDDSNPAIAADEDLIEKEWVEAVSRLQADYLNKRYGKVVKVPQEE